MLYNARNIPSHLKLWTFDKHGEIVFPRGFIFDFERILNKKNIEIEWDNQCIKNNVKFFNIPISLRCYQKQSVESLIKFGNGIYKAPTGSGKTRVMLELIRTLKQKTLVICEKNDILTQWVGVSRGLGFNHVCDMIHYESNSGLVILNRQSIWAQREVLDQSWYDQFGTVVVDECHHCSAETVFELIQRFPAYYRFGCSATPDSDPDLFPIARAVIGPVVSLTPVEEIGEHLVIPSVRVVKTEFTFPYRPTERRGKKIIRNNYSDMMSALEIDEDRNNLIAKVVYKEAQEGNICLVVSKRKNHLDEILDYMPTYGQDDNIRYYKLTGDNSNQYKEIADNIDNERYCILFSTLAEEGTDIPCLDRLFLTYPGRKVRGFEQAIGRIMRPHHKKKDAIVYDFRDINVPLLNSQFRDRCHQIYNKKGYKVGYP